MDFDQINYITDNFGDILGNSRPEVADYFVKLNVLARDDTQSYAKDIPLHMEFLLNERGDLLEKYLMRRSNRVQVVEEALIEAIETGNSFLVEFYMSNKKFLSAETANQALQTALAKGNALCIKAIAKGKWTFTRDEIEKAEKYIASGPHSKALYKYLEGKTADLMAEK